MKRKGIKNLTFDFGGVLINLNRQRCVENFRKLGLERVGELLGMYSQQGVFMQHEKGLISSTEFRENIRGLLTKEVTGEQVDAAWNSFLVGIPRFKLDMLLKLCEKYVVYLLGSTNEIHWKWACEHAFPYRGFRVGDYFEKMYLSYEMKMVRPAEKIFRGALEDASLDPRKTFFIDDSKANCQGAQALGISTYTVKPGEDWRSLFAGDKQFRRHSMQIIHNIPAFTPEPCVTTIDSFDGVHTGHRFLIKQVRGLTATRGLRSALITFPVRPRRVMKADYRPELLTTPEEKRTLLEETGADYCLMLDFTQEISRPTAREFMSDLLRDRYWVQALVIGYGHRFGHNRSEGFEDYCRYGSEMGIEVIRARVCVCDNLHVSSSVIRKMLHQGKADMASRCLGYDYFLDGTVVGGYQVGRKIGFPTANLSVDDPDKLIPADGVYAIHVTFDGHTYNGVLDIGTRPTIGNGPERSIEVNIFHFHLNIYDKFIRISFVEYPRPELRFDRIDGLITQLHRDAADVEVLLGSKQNVN